MFFAVSLLASIALSQPGTRTVAEYVASNPQLSTLNSLLVQTGLNAALNNTMANFTLFAPDNQAFQGIVPPNSNAVLTDILLYHVVSGYITSDMLSSGEVAPTLESQTVTVEIRNENVGIFDSNGRRANVIRANELASNGVVHIVDTVLLDNGTVANITENIPILSDLNGALVANNLISTLADPSLSLTLFAPSNNAVAAFSGTITAQDLLYHVITSEIFSTDLKDGNNVVKGDNTAQSPLDVIKNETGVFVKDATGREGQVFVANLAGVNGAVHIIDIVLEYSS